MREIGGKLKLNLIVLSCRVTLSRVACERVNKQDDATAKVGTGVKSSSDDQIVGIA